ncbi:WbuC family cupin fold metalloprotein [Burkholderiaceae bacterium DAT-1]|nr:WbuC family cupin fold metalloprotein [Burkholderiaceae bacterium DAT-1]
MKLIDTARLDQMVESAKASPRLRAHHNLHPHLDDPVQRLAIAMEPDTLVFPHRHPHTFELLTPLRGRFIVLYFDDAGVVTARTVLGEGTQVIENPAGQWHAVRSLDAGGVIFEVKQGAYQPLAPQDVASWAPASESDAARQLNDWYLTARVGDQAPSFS